MITFKDGDLLSSGYKVICHQVNCQGVMGSGIAKEIRKRFSAAYEIFRKSFLAGEAKLGNIDLAFDHDEYNQRAGCWIFICNMYAQYHYLPVALCTQITTLYAPVCVSSRMKSTTVGKITKILSSGSNMGLGVVLAVAIGTSSKASSRKSSPLMSGK